jgi:hypothetical protein
MYKVIYIPTCEEVQLHSYPRDKENLLRLFEEDTTIFFREPFFAGYSYPDEGRIKPMWNANLYKQTIPKYLFEIIEVEDEEI